MGNGVLFPIAASHMPIFVLALWGLWFAGANARSACFEDVLLCPDGEVRLRDPSLDCRFVPCGTATSTDDQIHPAYVHDCPLDFHLCEHGGLAERDPFNSCEFFECTSSSSGSDSRSPTPPSADDATASSATTETRCPGDVLICTGGFFVRRTPSRNCQFDMCPIQIECPADTKHCPGDLVVHRNHSNDCNFDMCPSRT